MIPKECEDQLRRLNKVFCEENRKLNLSAFRKEEQSWIGNVMDSLVLLDTGLLSSIPIPIPLPPPSFAPSELRTGKEEEGALRKKRTPPNILYFSREMRKNPTKAEEKLWEHLRHDQLEVRFRRQWPAGGHILDFYCPVLKLCIEVDGGIHKGEQKKEDRGRDSYLLEEHNIHTLRFNNKAVLSQTDKVIEQIKEHIQKHSPPPLEEGLGVEENNKQKQGLRVLDLGTGGGFPLLPLAICCPGCNFTGIDATQKKIAAVERIAKAIELTNVSYMAGRAEELGRDPAHRGQHDLVLSRAVAPINTLLELTAPFAKVGGHVVFWKSIKIEKELTDSLLARAELSCHLTDQYVYSLDNDNGLPTEALSDSAYAGEPRGVGWGKRQLLIFEKTFATKDKYPRATGIPKKKPLL